MNALEAKIASKGTIGDNNLAAAHSLNKPKKKIRYMKIGNIRIRSLDENIFLTLVKKRRSKKDKLTPKYCGILIIRYTDPGTYEVILFSGKGTEAGELEESRERGWRVVVIKILEKLPSSPRKKSQPKLLYLIIKSGTVIIPTIIINNAIPIILVKTFNFEELNIFIKHIRAIPIDIKNKDSINILMICD